MLEQYEIASVESLKHHKIEDFHMRCDKVKGNGWLAVAYVLDEDRIVVYAIAHGRKAKQTIKEALSNAIKRMNGEIE